MELGSGPRTNTVCLLTQLLNVASITEQLESHPTTKDQGQAGQKTGYSSYAATGL